MGGIDILVEGSPESLRETATKLNQLADLLHSNGGKVHRASSESEWCWSGKAADKGRAYIQGTGKVIDDVVDTTRKIARAHDELAAKLDGVITRVYQARGAAQQARLAVTETEILPPEPVGVQVPTGAQAQAPAGASRQGSPAPALAAHQQKQAAFEEASKSIEQARRDERDAHNRFRDETSKQTSVLGAIKNGALFSGLGVARTMYSSQSSNVKKYAEAATVKSQDARAAQNLYHNPNMSAARRAIAEEKYKSADSAARRAVRNAFSSYDLDQKLRAPEWIKTSLASAPGESLAKNGSNAFLRGAGAVAKQFPVSNLVLAGVGTGVSIAGGTKWDKAVATNVGSTAAATGVSVGAEVGLVALGVAGGPATVAALGAGIVVSTGVSWFMDNHWDDVKHTAKDAWDDISR